MFSSGCQELEWHIVFDWSLSCDPIESTRVWTCVNLAESLPGYEKKKKKKKKKLLEASMHYSIIVCEHKNVITVAIPCFSYLKSKQNYGSSLMKY